MDVTAAVFPSSSVPLENNKRFTACKAHSLTLSYPLLTTLERRADVNLRCLSKLKNGSPERERDLIRKPTTGCDKA